MRSWSATPPAGSPGCATAAPSYPRASPAPAACGIAWRATARGSCRHERVLDLSAGAAEQTIAGREARRVTGAVADSASGPGRRGFARKAMMVALLIAGGGCLLATGSVPSSGEGAALAVAAVAAALPATRRELQRILERIRN